MLTCLSLTNTALSFYTLMYIVLSEKKPFVLEAFNTQKDPSLADWYLITMNPKWVFKQTDYIMNLRNREDKQAPPQENAINITFLSY